MNFISFDPIMNSPKPTIALIVHSCDRYQFLYKGFYHFFCKYWDFDINCRYYFATELLDINLPGFENIKSGKGQWSDRLSYLLRKKIKEDYVLYLQEDVWLTKPVNAEFFKQLFKLTIENKWKQVKINSSEVYKTIPSGLFIEGFVIGVVDNQKSDYLMSHQAALWNKQFLIEQLAKNEHPWRNERRGTKRLRKLNPVIYQIDYFSDSGKGEVNNNINPIGRSEYVTVSENGGLNIKIIPFIEELLFENGELLAYGKDLKRHYDNNLTHDGKERPRKEGLLLKLKKRIMGRE